MVAGVKMPGVGGGLRILGYLRELSFCGPCEPCFNTKCVTTLL